MNAPNNKPNPLEEPIVIVPKDPAAEAEVSAVLQKHGYKVIVCRDADRVFDIGKDKPHFWKPKIIVVDIVLPKVSAFELVRKLVDKYATKRVPVIMASPYESKEDEAEAYSAGAVSMIKKPLTAEMIEAIVEKEALRKTKDDAMKQVFEIKYD